MNSGQGNGTFWHEVYERPTFPWDIGTAQPELASAVACGEVLGPNVLDVGCGTGDNAILLARSGFKVDSFDLVERAVLLAKERIVQAEITTGSVEVYQADVFSLDKTPLANRQYDTVLDSAVFHCIGDDETQRRYVLASV